MEATTRPARDAHLLATLAESLNPERAPFYVQGAANGHPDGWYWIPAGTTRPQYLGRNVIFAERALLKALHQ